MVIKMIKTKIKENYLDIFLFKFVMILLKFLLILLK